MIRAGLITGWAKISIDDQDTGHEVTFFCKCTTFIPTGLNSMKYNKILFHNLIHHGVRGYKY